MRTIDGVSEGVEERRVTLERTDCLFPLVLISEAEGDVVLVLLRVGISRQVGLLDHGDDEQRLEELPDAVLTRPLRHERRRVHLGLARLLRTRPRQNVRHRHGVVRRLQGEPAVRGHRQQQAGVGERQADAVGGLENGVETRHRDAAGAKGILARPTARDHRAQQTGAHHARCPPGYVHHGSHGKGQRGESVLTRLPRRKRRGATARDQSR